MYRLLLVEDDQMLRESYLMILSTETYDIDSAENGEQAIERCAGVVYDLILLDLMMPVVDGVKFLELYIERQLPPTKVLLLSNLSSGAELAAALQLGARRSVLKSELSPRQLLATVRSELAV